MHRRLAGSFVLLALVWACSGAEVDADDDGSGAGEIPSAPSSSSGGGAASSSGEATSSSGAVPPPDGGSSGALQLPPTGGLWDYQIGTPYPPPTGVSLVSRDRGAQPAVGIYNICYVNGFQAQPSENPFWLEQHPDLVLRERGEPVIDPDWDEMLLDVSTPAKRMAIAAIADGWFAECKAKGFQAIEIDNLDTYSRSNGLLAEDDCVAMERLFADAAHARGLAIGQKNSAEIVARKAEMATDFAVVEECHRWDECDDYTAGYGEHVYIVEYREQDFSKACAAAHPPTVHRDPNLVGPADDEYVYSQCP